jgi:hypothetical protein
LHSIADARCFGHSAFAARYAELRSFAAKTFRAVENDREKIFVEWRAFSSRALNE